MGRRRPSLHWCTLGRQAASISCSAGLGLGCRASQCHPLYVHAAGTGLTARRMLHSALCVALTFRGSCEVEEVMRDSFMCAKVL